MAFEMIIFALMFLKSFSYRGERAAPLRPPPPPPAVEYIPEDCRCDSAHVVCVVAARARVFVRVGTEEVLLHEPPRRPECSGYARFSGFICIPVLSACLDY